MCVIIDASVCGLVFGDPPAADYVAVLDWLTTKDQDGVLVVGGHLKEELFRSNRARRFVLELRRSKRASFVEDSEVQREQVVVQQALACASDDPHVIALARVSGARTLCAVDGPLEGDFTNTRLLCRPPGRVYKRSPDHLHLLRHTSSCRAYRHRR
jgi:hypothetical protein